MNNVRKLDITKQRKPCRPSASTAAMAEECPHCRDDTHYRIEGDGIAVLRPETLADCPTFRAAIDAAEIGRKMK